MPDFGIFRGFNDKLFGDKLYAGQLPINLGMIASDFVDPDALAFFARVTAAGGILSATEQTAVNTLVRQMKLDGIWTKMKAIYPMVGASAAACAQNLKSSSFTGTFTSGWTFASTGVKANGTGSCFFDTKVLFSSVSTTSNSYGLYTRTNLIESSADMGISGNYQLGVNFSGFGAFARNLALVTTGSVNSDTRGFYNCSRIVTTEFKYFKNATTLSTVIANSATPIATMNIALGGEMLTGNLAVAAPSSKEFAFAFIGDGLDSSENTLYYNAVQTFQTTLSRQV
jgi:hypothetical protein